MAAAELERRRRLRSASLLDFVPMLSPHRQRPTPLQRIAELLQASKSRPVRGLSSVPPQHGKTELISHAFVWRMLADAKQHHAYVTYQQARAHEVSRYIFRLATAAGLRPEGNVGLWHLTDGGSFRARGIDAGLTGAPVTGLLVVDDPHKNRQEAESAIIRGRVHEEFSASVESRTHPTTSVIVNHTRWHEDDLIGRLSADEEVWGEPINLPAINDAGEPLWPDLHPLAELQRKRASNEYDWWSLYMGQPRPAGAQVFRDVQYYETLPTRYRVAIGFDLAATAKTSSDYCAAVVLAETLDEERAADRKYFVLDVRRERATVPQFAAQLRVLKAAYPGARMLWYTSTTEKATADLLREETGLPVLSENATVDKLQRAQPVAAAWNALAPAPGCPEGRPGRIYLPRSAPWLADFVSEVCGFTGRGDRHDDQVDAFAAAFDQLTRGSGLSVVRSHKTQFGASVPMTGGKGGFHW